MRLTVKELKGIIRESLEEADGWGNSDSGGWGENRGTRPEEDYEEHPEARARRLKANKENTLADRKAIRSAMQVLRSSEPLSRDLAKALSKVQSELVADTGSRLRLYEILSLAYFMLVDGAPEEAVAHINKKLLVLAKKAFKA